MSERAPIFTAAYALARWTLSVLDTQSGTLAARVCRDALAVLETLALALKDPDPDLQLEEADETLVRLRLGLRLAADIGLIEERQMLHGLGLADDVGRQLGGWRRSRDGG
jgi:hypothetical protein